MRGRRETRPARITRDEEEARGPRLAVSDGAISLTLNTLSKVHCLVRDEQGWEVMTGRRTLIIDFYH